MFVRNNTTCPACGNHEYFDVTLDWVFVNAGHRTMRFRCILCDFQVNKVFSQDDLWEILRNVLRRFPSDSINYQKITQHYLTDYVSSVVLKRVKLKLAGEILTSWFQDWSPDAYFLLGDETLANVVDYCIRSSLNPCDDRVRFYRTVGL